MKVLRVVNEIIDYVVISDQQKANTTVSLELLMPLCSDVLLDLINFLDVIVVTIDYRAAAQADHTFVNFHGLALAERFVLLADKVKLVNVLLKLNALVIQRIVVPDHPELDK